MPRHEYLGNEKPRSGEAGYGVLGRRAAANTPMLDLAQDGGVRRPDAHGFKERRCQGQAKDGAVRRDPESRARHRQVCAALRMGREAVARPGKPIQRPNNGDLCVAWGTTPKFKGMKDRGWRSKGTLYRSLRQLQDCGFIEQTRQGGKHRASLYAVTWQPIDERLDPTTKKHKLDAKPTFVAAGTWQDRPGN